MHRSPIVQVIVLTIHPWVFQIKTLVPVLRHLLNLAQIWAQRSFERLKIFS